MTATAPTPISPDDLMNQYRNLTTSLKTFYESSQDLLSKTKVFIKNQADYVENNDELIHGIMLAAFSLNIVYFGGFTAIGIFFAAAIGDYAFSKQIVEAVERISYIWKTKSVQFGMATVGFMLIARNPWLLASTVLGCYASRLIKAAAQQQPPAVETDANNDNAAI